MGFTIGDVGIGAFAGLRHGDELADGGAHETRGLRRPSMPS